MPIRTLPWPKLGWPAGWSGTRPSLQTYFGASWPSVMPHFLPTQQLALSIDCPRPGGPGCPRQIVEHSFNDLVAVCGNSPQECPSLPVSRQDVIIYELNIGPLLADLGLLLHIKGAPQKMGHLTWNLGTYAASGLAASQVFICLEADEYELRLAIRPLLNQPGRSFLLLIPSRLDCPASLLLILQDAQVGLVAMDELAIDDEANSALVLARYAPVASLPAGGEPENYFRREHDYWQASFRGKPYKFKQSIGIRYIIHLIQRAYHDSPEIDVLDLYYLEHGRPPVTKGKALDGLSPEELAKMGLVITGLEEGLEVMTPEGMERMRQIKREIEHDMVMAEKVGDGETALRLREKLEQIEDYIAEARGLGGRLRKKHDQNTKNAATVESAIRHFMTSNGLKTRNPLVIYLNRQLKKGQKYSFRVDPDIAWQVFM